MLFVVKIRVLLFPILFFCHLSAGMAQLALSGVIKDASSNQPIPFCAVGLKNKTTGCLTNEDGTFIIKANNIDTLVITCIGYTPKQVQVSQFIEYPVILLAMSETVLQEVVVYSNDDYLYELLAQSRKKLSESAVVQAKTYFLLETEIDRQPVELVECYYNGDFDNNRIDHLEFKNGRIGVAPYRDRFFVSLNSSKAFTYLNLVYPDPHMPSNPFQYTKKNLKKNFTLHLVKTYDSLHPVYQIKFEPLDVSRAAFRGEVHIDENSKQVVKIILEINNTQKHPFTPLFSNAKIKDVSMQITKTFDRQLNGTRLHHIDFNYQLNYKVNDSLRIIKSKGLMYFYDYNRLFIPPYFKYNTETDDYRKITSLSYNDAFWASNTALVYTDKMKEGLAYFGENGLLLNYKNDGNLKEGILKNSFFENNYLMWQADKRIRLKIDRIRNDTIDSFSEDQQFLSNRYALKAQIFLDVTITGDSLQHYSAAIFDVFNSFYNIKEESFTNCFMNIYFDLIEIERRKMENEIAKNKTSLKHIETCYKQSLMNIETQGALYFREVERGKNLKKLEKWNEKVKNELGINNVQQFNILAR